MNRTIVFAILFAGSWLMAHVHQDQSQQPPKDKQGWVTVQGCVSRASGDFILMQSNPANSYVLRPTGKLKLDPNLGQRSLAAKALAWPPLRIPAVGQLLL
jgi:hypothetical protein